LSLVSSCIELIPRFANRLSRLVRFRLLTMNESITLIDSVNFY
jgi:hypothetical protein